MDVLDTVSNLPSRHRVRVLGLVKVITEPDAGRVLRGFGTSVAEIEDPASGGDRSRQLSPMKSGASLVFTRTKVGKHAAAVDLRAVGGRDVVHRSVKASTSCR